MWHLYIYWVIFCTWFLSTDNTLTPFSNEQLWVTPCCWFLSIVPSSLQCESHLQPSLSTFGNTEKFGSGSEWSNPTTGIKGRDYVIPEGKKKRISKSGWVWSRLKLVNSWVCLLQPAALSSQVSFPTWQDGFSKLVAVVGRSIAGLDGHLQRSGEAGGILPLLPFTLPGEDVAWTGQDSLNEPLHL